jgi:hypothetical protein
MPTQSRVRFPRGTQREFIADAIARCGGAITLAQQLNLSTRTIRDWRREKFLMSYEAAREIIEQYNIPLPKNLTIEDEFWYVTKGAQKGGLASYAKQGGQIGDPAVRQQKWQEWWDREGQFAEHPMLSKPLPIKKPQRSIALAEFVGIVLGDGAITHYQIVITLHHTDEIEYIAFVKKLIKELFDIDAQAYHHPEDSVFDITSSRRELVTFCVEELGLHVGNKVRQQVDIPDWIKENKEFSVACLRGLVDTDGSIFTHRYKSNGHWYAYKKMDYTSMSKPMLASAADIFRSVDLHPRIARGKSVRLDRQADVHRYFATVGSHNSKHLKRYQKLI